MTDIEYVKINKDDLIDVITHLQLYIDLIEFRNVDMARRVNSLVERLEGSLKCQTI